MVKQGLIYKLLAGFLAIWVAVAVLALLVDRGAQLYITFRSAAMVDFRTFYVGGRLTDEGKADQLYDVDAQRQVVEPEPILKDSKNVFYSQPVVALLFAPLARLELRPAFQLWSLISIAMLAMTVAITLSLTPDLPLALRLL